MLPYCDTKDGPVAKVVRKVLEAEKEFI